MGDDPQREPVGAGLADLVQLEERWSRDQPVLAQPDQEGGVAFIEHQAGRLGHLGELAGEVDDVVAVAAGPGGQDQQPVGASRCWQLARICWRVLSRVGWLTRPRLAGSAE